MGKEQANRGVSVKGQAEPSLAGSAPVCTGEGR
jgi:hypothetical protein